LNDDLVDLEGSLDGVFLRVHPLEFLEGSALGLNAVVVLALRTFLKLMRRGDKERR